MALGPRLDLRQSQQLVITPQLQQAIRLLTLSNVELQAQIAEELEKNPLLELEEDGGPSDEIATPAPEAGTAELDAALEAQGAVQAAEPLDVDLDAERFHHDSVGDGGASLDDDALGLDAFAAPEESLHEHLTRQAGARLSGAELVIAAHLIDLIDDSGYLAGSCAEVAERLGASLEAVEAVLAVIQSFEPTGVGARTLGECLALQAREADRYDPCMAALLANLDMVARGDLAALRRACDVDQEDLADMLRELRSYDPRPGLRFGGGQAQTVVPDVFVARTPKGWSVELNAATLPRLIVNRQYKAMLGKGDKASRSFVSECEAQAGWLIRALDQRAQTILKVTTELVRQQEAFFERGITHLRPMTLRVIAEAIGMHESTVSRVTSNKYLSCARGLFELKSFFSVAVATDSGEDASAAAVRARIRTLIEGEDPMKPLSDDKLVELLKRDGYEIARRTVAKYREAMGIPTSFDRRRRALVRAA